MSRTKQSLCRCHAWIGLVGLVAIFFLGKTTAHAENWPAWRGPEGTGVSTEKKVPTTWDRTTNVLWRVDLPEPCNSTPIVWEERIFLTQPTHNGARRTILCLDRATGKKRWQAGVDYAQAEPSHKANPYCSPSPVTDGSRVVAWFGSAGLVCYDMDGKRLWHRALGPQQHMWGHGSSPVLYGRLCILNFGPGNREFLLAVDKETGKTVWRVDAPAPPEEGDFVVSSGGGEQERAAPGSERAQLLRGSWGTPLVIQVDGHAELIVAFPGHIAAFEPETGHELWRCQGLGELVYASPMWAGGVIMAMGGYRSASLGVRPGGRGDVTDSHRQWQTPRSELRLGTGVGYKGRLYLASMRGVIECLDPQSGDALYQQRLKGSSGNNAIWSSPVLADGKLYFLNQAGDTFVVRAGPKFELLAKNSLAETTNSSPVISDGRLLIRTHEGLWFIGQSSE